MKNILIFLLILIAGYVAYIAYIGDKKIDERDNTITTLLNENRLLKDSLYVKVDSINNLQEYYIEKQDSLKNTYNEKINQNKRYYEAKIDNVRTLSIDNSIELFTKFISKEDSIR